MKVIGNPWIVGGLCVVAVAVVGYQFLPPRGPAASAAAPGSLALTPAASPARPASSPLPERGSDAKQAAAHTTASTNAPPPAALIDRAYVQAHFAQWLQAPKRDPFIFVTVAKSSVAPASISPVSHWKLKSIWRQTGSQLAAINGGLYSVGDSIEGYRIEQIGSDVVWFQGPTGRESLGFTNYPPANTAPPGTNAPVRPGTIREGLDSAQGPPPGGPAESNAPASQ